MTPKKDLELYLHIPFCRQKCRYCDFLSAPLAADNSTADGYVPEAYVDALLAQIVQESQFYQERRVTTIFWGGGTPSLLRVRDMERLMDAIRAHFCVADDAEITLLEYRRGADKRCCMQRPPGEKQEGQGSREWRCLEHLLAAFVCIQ